MAKATKTPQPRISAPPPGELSKGAPVKQPARHFAAGGILGSPVDPYAGMNRLEVAQYTNDPEALNAAFDRDHAESKPQGITIPGVASTINQAAQNPLAAETSHQQDIDQRQSRITTYADKLKAMEANGRANGLMGFSSTITRGFSEGGKPETPDELMARIAGKYGVTGQVSAAPVQQPAPQPQQKAQQLPQAQGLTPGIVGILKGRAAQIDKAAGYANGGKIEGKGTPTSDSIPGLVRETGEAIRVSTQERILSKAQDAFLEEIAQASGFESLNAMLQAGTGQPVGPTIKGGKRAAATGMEPEYHYDPALDAQVKQRAMDSAEARRNQNETAPYNSSRLPSDAVPVALDASGRTPEGLMPGSLASPSSIEKPAAAGGLSSDRVAAAIAAPPTLGGAPLARSEPVGGGLTRAAQQVGYRPEVNGINWNAKGFDPTKQEMSSGTGTIAITSGPNAGKNIAVGPQNYTATDGTPTSDWSKTAQYSQGVAQANKDRETLATMQRDRMERDAYSPEITDPRAQINARQQLHDIDAKAGKEGEAYGRMLDNQGKLTKLASDGQIAGLQAQYLGETDPVRREALAERIRGVTGKSTAPTPANLQHIETERGTMVFDPRTGRMVPAVGPDGAPVGSGKALTEFQGKSTSFGIRADAASKIIDQVGQGGKVQPSLIKRAAESVPLIGEGLGMAANRFASPEQQQIEQAEKNFVAAILRQESGAAIAQSEFDNARKQYFPQPGDSPEVITQKKENREAAINGFRISAGPGGKNIGGAPAQSQTQQPQQPAAAPKVGMVDGKHVFLGGNPADPASWAEVR